MTQSDAIKGIRRAAQRRERADVTRREATNELRRYCRDAQKAGVSISQIAREAGLSRQGVTTCSASDLLDEGQELAPSRDWDALSLGRPLRLSLLLGHRTSLSELTGGAYEDGPRTSEYDGAGTNPKSGAAFLPAERVVEARPGSANAG